MQQLVVLEGDDNARQLIVLTKNNHGTVFLPKVHTKRLGIADFLGDALCRFIKNH
jgi:hypothetical protein